MPACSKTVLNYFDDFAQKKCHTVLDVNNFYTAIYHDGKVHVESWNNQPLYRTVLGQHQKRPRVRDPVYLAAFQSTEQRRALIP